jgi:POT family proton-dependent oligopeptide transporter
MPLLGAYMADQYWGRFMTIQIACGIALLGHCILIISAIPPVITNPNGAIAAFSIGIVIMGVGVGGFKSNISPLIAEQVPEDKIYVKTNSKGKRVIVDPAITYSRVFLYCFILLQKELQSYSSNRLNNS